MTTARPPRQALRQSAQLTHTPANAGSSGPSVSTVESVVDLQFHRLGRVGYQEAWTLQRHLHARRVAGEVGDTVLLLEHDSVYTAGRRTEDGEHPIDGTPVVDVDRGGKITWHGPGQLIGYPIVALPEPIDVVGHVRRLEEALIAGCASIGLVTVRINGRSGTWVTADSRGPDRKVAAIGVRVTRGVAMHGFALNCDCDLGAFDRIVPCGIADAGVTSLSAELGRKVTVADALPILEAELARLLSIVRADKTARSVAKDSSRW
jgi:lipoyl(octanoyl) transferase